MDERYLDYYQMLSHWLEEKIAGISAADYFREMGYRGIAVYGMGELANRLCEDLVSEGMEILYGIDRDASISVSRISEVYSLQDKLPEADVIVVTPFYDFPQICNVLRGKCDCPIVSLEEVIWSI